MTAGEELYGVLLGETLGLGPEVRLAVALAIENRGPWDTLPEVVRETFEGWAELLLRGDLGE